MANYIKRDVIAEAYTHLEVNIFDDKSQLSRLEKELKEFFGVRASFIFGTEVDVRVEFEEGSLKTKVIAYASAAAVLLGPVANYSSFRESVAQMAADAAALAQMANIEVVFRTKTPRCDRIRIEKRRGVFGRVDSFLSELDSIGNELSGTSLPTKKAEIKSLDASIDNLINLNNKIDILFEKLESDETIACISAGLLKEFKKLPRTFGWEREMKRNSSIRAQILNSDPALSAAASGTAARYVAAVKQIEKNLENRLE
ncbi:hypothetical protein [Xanthomonas arboricola]|uniref:hypothetical protein n=1 Tax=Xanthomonas arboricola TaxID=56448 RepID=UPI0011B08BC6|nr:hypothetical protein [Xanthomonas arboricola]